MGDAVDEVRETEGDRLLENMAAVDRRSVTIALLTILVLVVTSESMVLRSAMVAF